MNKRIGKTDLLLIGLLLLAGLAGTAALKLLRPESGAAVRITVDGAVYGTYDLSQTQTIPITAGGADTNTLQIKDGQAKMIQADCPDKLCMHQKAVSRQGETIVCLPNKVVVEIEGSEAAHLDAVSQ